MNDWEFYHYADGQWTWRTVMSESARESDHAFETWIEAMADAIQDGFQAGEARICLKVSRRSQPRGRRD